VALFLQQNSTIWLVVKEVIMSTEFNGQKLLVIGGTSGMGLQTARMVLEQGASVVIVGHREDKAGVSLQIRSQQSPAGSACRF
jgi:NAD(P)-dependent dehydrogenase (short-subunit alcohol dehydrogenase family)